jgi:arsenite methyltransferase
VTNISTFLDKGESEMTTIDEQASTTDSVKAHYGAVARQVTGGESVTQGCGAAGGCCGPTTERGDPITADLYDHSDVAGLPANALLASLGCGNPTALAELREGEIVLDLGSGGGIDVLLSAKRVGPTGKAYGLDMTDDMLALAEQNRASAGVANVEFMKGSIESIPLPDATLDVIISNCVINLSGDKRAVISESFRVLKPGGRLAVSDILTRGALPEEVREHMGLWTGCVAGALDEEELVSLLTEAGFADAEIEPTRVYTREDAASLLAGAGLDTSLAESLEGKIFSGFVRATKPRG